MKPAVQLLSEPLPVDPLAVAERWLAEAWSGHVQTNPDAMVLATCDSKGQPSARVVLCKQIVATPGYLLFYTNYRSRKGHELALNSRAAAVLHWDALQRQVRIEGPVTKATAEESDRYFASRAWQSQIGAWASEQSEPVGSRDELVASVKAIAERFAAPDPLAALPTQVPALQIPRPPHWGGYRLWAQSVELWVEGEYRIHDRARWSRELRPLEEDSFAPTAWKATRLQP